MDGDTIHDVLWILLPVSGGINQTAGLGGTSVV